MKPPPSHSLVNQIVVLTLGLLVFGGTLGLGAVWARRGISDTANRSRALVVKIVDVQRRLDEVTAEVAAAVNPDSLLKQNQAMRLALVAPREIQVVRVAESPELRLAAKRNREVFFSVGTLPSAEPSVRATATTTPVNQTSFRIITTAAR